MTTTTRRRRTTGEPFHPLRGESLAKRVSQALIAAILRGDLPSGEFLPSEEVLCERFEVSRPVVREAIRVLVHVGMARTRQGQGSIVLDEAHWNELAPDVLLARIETGTVEKVMDEVIELRSILETRAAELALERATPADVERMVDHVRAMEESLDSQERFLVHDLAFHREMVRAGGNRLVLKLFDLIEPMLLSARVAAFEHQRLPDGMIRGVDEHRAIAKALADGTSDQLHEAVMRHLTGARERATEVARSPIEAGDQPDA
ncbi:MAG: FadR/GntR family transcriptional regulator [Actinomycetota bacterium]|nr:FadR/GntR family transcriptional regulator [Actinomycetota bacterium]